jgi:hypothetical protein
VELQADAFGMIYMTNAGYDPRAVLGEGDFFATWASQLQSMGIAPPESHPQPEQRAAFFASQMMAVAENLDLYDFGVRLFELGRFEDAIVLLERFGDNYASLEVLNNIGLSPATRGLVPEPMRRADSGSIQASHGARPGDARSETSHFRGGSLAVPSSREIRPSLQRG